MELKKIILAVLVLLLLALSSCGDGDLINQSDTNDSREVSSVQTEDTDMGTDETHPEETRNDSGVVWTPFY